MHVQSSILLQLSGNRSCLLKVTTYPVLKRTAYMSTTGRFIVKFDKHAIASNHAYMRIFLQPTRANNRPSDSPEGPDFL